MKGQGSDRPVLDQQVTVQRLTLTPDGVGGYTEQWSTVYTLWAKVRGQTGSEFRQTEQRVVGRERYEVIIRDVDAPDLTIKDRVTWGDKLLNILAAPPAQRTLYRFLQTEWGVAQ